MKSEHYEKRRRALSAQFESPIVLSAYFLSQRTNDAAFAFDQESNFFYLTGITSPDWRLVFNTERSWLVSPDIDEVHQIFDGSLSWDEAKEISGVDEVISRKDSESLIVQFASQHDSIVTLGPDPRAGHYDFVLNQGPVLLYEDLKKDFSEVKDCRKALAKLRAIKQPEEIEAIRQAISLTSKAFEQVKSKIADYSHEYEIESDFSHYFRSRGLEGYAYDPIVAAGKNACTLHYGHNQSTLTEDELALIDIGARVDGYAADITRTYSLGKPTQRAKAVHAAVENAHKEIISLLRPGLDIHVYHEQVDVIMKKALEGLGLLKSDEDYRNYFPHAISHGLGIDVHDSLGGPEVFLPGMVLTVEPGIYIPEEGIGVRIEDDILITADGHENLSQSLSTAL